MAHLGTAKFLSKAQTDRCACDLAIDIVQSINTTAMKNSRDCC
jgi:hypothetical protein